MTTELTKAAQRLIEASEAAAKHFGYSRLGGCTLKDSNVRVELRNAADALRNALTQRPAAQAGEDGACTVMPLIEDYAKAVHDGDDALCQVLRRTIEASLPAPQQATPEAEFKRINCKVNGIDGTAEVRRVDENTVDIGRMVAFADERATPEPVGEPLQGGLENDALLNAWRSKLPGVTPTDAQMTAFALGVEVGFAHARTLERSDWSRVHEALQAAGVHPGRTDDHLADVIAKALANRPAPGVPEFDVVGYVLPEALEELRMSGESAAIHDWRMRDDLVPVYVLRKPGAPGPISELLTALGPILAAVGTNDGDSMGSLNSDDKVLWTVSSSWSADVRVTLGDLRKIALAAAQAKGADK